MFRICQDHQVCGAGEIETLPASPEKDRQCGCEMKKEREVQGSHSDGSVQFFTNWNGSIGIV